MLLTIFKKNMTYIVIFSIFSTIVTITEGLFFIGISVGFLVSLGFYLVFSISDCVYDGLEDYENSHK